MELPTKPEKILRITQGIRT